MSEETPASSDPAPADSAPGSDDTPKEGAEDAVAPVEAVPVVDALPAEQAPPADAPAGDAPATEECAAETPVADVPGSETPADAPETDAPATEASIDLPVDTSAGETPAEAPTDNTPVPTEDATPEEAPPSDVPAVAAPADGVPVDVVTEYSAPDEGATPAEEAQPEPFPEIKSAGSLLAKYLTPQLWEKLCTIKTKTSGFTLAQGIACSIQYDDQTCGIYAGDWDSYKDFSEVFEPVILAYHGISGDSVHTTDMDVSKITGNIDSTAPVKSTRIRVGRNIDGFGLSPGILKGHRMSVEDMMKTVFSKLTGDLAGTYYPLSGMDEAVRQKLIDDHFLFVSGDKNLITSGMERDWPEGRGIFHNSNKTFLVWVNEEDQLRIISMQQGSDVKGVFELLVHGITAIEDCIKNEFGHTMMFDERYGYIHTCPTNLGTGMRASVHVDLPGYTKEGISSLKKRCEELHLQPRGTRGESGGHVDATYDISNKHRLGYTEVELVQKLIDGVNILVQEDKQIMEDLSHKTEAPAAEQSSVDTPSDATPVGISDATPVGMEPESKLPDAIVKEEPAPQNGCTNGENSANTCVEEKPKKKSSNICDIL